MVATGKYMFDYLGNPDMNMASIAAGFGVKGEQVSSPGELQAALARAKAMTAEGKPYLIDVQVARRGVGWVDKPWVPSIQIADLGTKKG
jgi:thiamine pyrophosphate-dependent acetolactate synthase large subunit-like protein